MSPYLFYSVCGGRLKILGNNVQDRGRGLGLRLAINHMGPKVVLRLQIKMRIRV